MSLASRVDQWLVQYAGYPYMRVTRDDSSFERISYLLRFLQEQDRPVRLLDAGCSGAISLYVLEREAPQVLSGFVGADWLATRLYERYKSYRTPHQFFDTNLDDDWNHGEFDVVWCSECLEHIMDDNGVFKKLCGSVKPGGYIVISVPSEAYRNKFGKAIPELLVTSKTQDGGHVRVGYTPESLVRLAAGTSAELVRVDAITRSDETYMRRRIAWGPFMQRLRNAYYTLTRGKKDFYTLGATPSDLEQFQSIAAVYRVG